MRSHSALRRCRSSASSNRFKNTIGAGLHTTAHRRTKPIVPRPASATRTTASAANAAIKLRVSPSCASGERRPPAPSTSVMPVSGASQLAHEIRDVDLGEAERVGDHRRRHRQRKPAVPGADAFDRFAGRRGKHVGVGRRVGRGERLHGFAGVGAEGAARERGRDVRLADVGAGPGHHHEASSLRHGGLRYVRVTRYGALRARRQGRVGATQPPCRCARRRA